MRFPFLLSAALLCASIPAHADTVTDIIDVNASGNNGQTVQLSYSLTWDPTQNYLVPSSAGLQLLSVHNSDPGFAAAFAQPAGWTYFLAPNGSLVIGGLGQYNAEGEFYVPSGVDDYLVDFALNLGEPTFVGLFEGSSTNTPSFAVLTTGSVTFTPGIASSAVTPEPSSIALLGTGLLSLCGLARRRFVPNA